MAFGFVNSAVFSTHLIKCMLRVRDPREAIVFVAIRNWTPFTLNFSADRSLAALDQLISTILSFAFHFARETAGMLVALTISIDSVRANVFSSLERWLLAPPAKRLLGRDVLPTQFFPFFSATLA